MPSVRPSERRISLTKTVPAPVGGWNARDPLAAMPVEDAVIMINMFPRTGDVVSRNGYTVWASGMSGPVETLMEYDSGILAKKLFAANAGKFYDVSASGPVGAPVASGFTSNRWQHVKFGTPAGQFISAVNGVDTPQQYNGTAWSNSTISGSGLTPTNLNNVACYEQRLFFTENATLRFWYLPVNQITGTALSFDLSSLCKLGGSLLAIAVWTIDGGSGLQNNICFFTSRGEVIVYNGTDPSTPSLWSFLGVYRISAPIGRRCLCQFGGDVLVITQNGVFPLSQALITARATPKVAITDKISAAVNAVTQTYSGNFGWQLQLYPKGTYGLLNIPIQEDGQSQQYVWNEITGAWTQFTNQNANVWTLFNEQLMFGDSSGNVMLADNGSADNAAVINMELLQAFQNFDQPGALKDFKMLRPIFNAGNTVMPIIGLNIDFDTTPPSASPQPSQGSGTFWDTAFWDTFPWAGTTGIRQQWIGISGLGHWASAHMKVSSSTQPIGLMATDYMYALGGPV